MKWIASTVSAAAVVLMPVFQVDAASGGFSLGQAVLEMDGQVLPLQDFSGGGGSGQMVEAGQGTEVLANPRYNPIFLKTSLPAPALQEWIKGSIAAELPLRDGKALLLDHQQRARGLEFKEALISEIGLPALDASSREAGSFSIKISPGTSTYGSDFKGTVPIGKIKKRWVNSNFRLKLGDLPCERVSKIDAITIKQKTVETAVNGGREIEVQGAKTEISDLNLVISAVDIKPWNNFYEESFVSGREVEPLKGSLEILSPDLKPLFTLQLEGVALRSFVPFPTGAVGEGRSFAVSLHVEKIGLVFEKVE